MVLSTGGKLQGIRRGEHKTPSPPLPSIFPTPADSLTPPHPLNFISRSRLMKHACAGLRRALSSSYKIEKERERE